MNKLTCNSVIKFSNDDEETISNFDKTKRNNFEASQIHFIFYWFIDIWDGSIYSGLLSYLKCDYAMRILISCAMTKKSNCMRHLFDSESTNAFILIGTRNDI